MKPKRQPDYIESRNPSDNFLQHINHLAVTLRQLERMMPGLGDPAKVTTEWRDDGPGEANGWISIVEWPVEVKG